MYHNYDKIKMQREVDIMLSKLFKKKPYSKEELNLANMLEITPTEFRKINPKKRPYTEDEIDCALMLGMTPKEYRKYLKQPKKRHVWEEVERTGPSDNMLEVLHAIGMTETDLKGS